MAEKGFKIERGFVLRHAYVKVGEPRSKFFGDEKMSQILHIASRSDETGGSAGLDIWWWQYEW